MALFALPIHARTGLRALGIVGGKPLWPILGGDDSDDAAAQAQAAADNATAETAAAEKAAADAKSEFDYPAETALHDMSPDQKAEYWREKAQTHERRAQASERAGRVSPERLAELKAKAKRADDLDYELSTDKDKAVANAKKSAAEGAAAEYLPRLVNAEFRAAAAGRIEPERLTTILEPLDMSKFLAADNSVDTAKVATFVNGIAPVMGTGKPPAVGPSSRGQGQRNSSASPSVASGRDRYAQRHPHRSPA